MCGLQGPPSESLLRNEPTSVGQYLGTYLQVFSEPPRTLEHRNYLSCATIIVTTYEVLVYNTLQIGERRLTSDLYQKNATGADKLAPLCSPFKFGFHRQTHFDSRFAIACEMGLFRDRPTVAYLLCTGFARGSKVGRKIPTYTGAKRTR